MSVKEIDDDNATRDNVYTIHTTQIHTDKYIEHNPSKPIITSMR